MFITPFFARVMKIPPSKILNLWVFIRAYLNQYSNNYLDSYHCIQGYMTGPGLVVLSHSPGVTSGVPYCQKGFFGRNFSRLE